MIANVVSGRGHHRSGTSYKRGSSIERLFQQYRRGIRKYFEKHSMEENEKPGEDIKVGEYYK